MGGVYYNRYPGDYRRDTGHLSLAQHGAYCLLLDAYYSTGKPLPPSIDALVRIVGAQGSAERAAVKAVADEFFPVCDDGARHNQRGDRELERRADYGTKQAERANKRWQRQHDASAMPAHDTGNASALPRAPVPSPSPSPIPKPEPHAPPTPTGASVSGFSEFWKTYPRKVGREAALRAWISTGAAEHAGAIADALAWQVQLPEWQRDGGRFVPKPENYLFERRWTDEQPALAPELEQQPPPAKCSACGIRTEYANGLCAPCASERATKANGGGRRANEDTPAAVGAILAAATKGGAP